MAENKTEQTTLHNNVVESIRDLIFEGELIGGQRIPEKLICKKLSISRTPLREALKVLASEQLITLLPNRGARVNRLKGKDIDDMFPVMGALEALAGELACKEISDAQIDEIRSLHYQMSADHKNGNLNNYFELNQRIHAAIMAATKNTTICELYSLLAGRIRIARYRANFSKNRWDQAMAEHEKILDALSKRDSSRLTKILRTHLEKTCETVKSIIEKESF